MLGRQRDGQLGDGTTTQRSEPGPVNGFASGPPTLSIDDVAVVEGDAGTTDAVFTVSLSASSADPVAVNVDTSDDSATAPDDYVGLSTAVSFDPGDTSETVSVQVKGDGDDEVDETFFVDLSTATNATIGDDRGVGTITDDDDAGGIGGPGSLRLASTSDAGVKGNDWSVHAAISGDGSTVAFASNATNLDGKDKDAITDIYVKDLESGNVTLASVPDDGTNAFGGNALAPQLSDDGDLVAFAMGGSIDPADTNFLSDVYLKNVTTGDVRLVSTNDTGAVGNGSTLRGGHLRRRHPGGVHL